MARERFKTFEALQREMRRRGPPDRPNAHPSEAVGPRVALPPRTPGGGEDAPPRGDALCVRFEMTRDADRSVVDECRALALAWMQDAAGGALPRMAWRLRSFEHRGDRAVCAAARRIEKGVDRWAAQVVERPDPNQESVSEIVIAPHSVGDPPSIFVRIQDRSVVPRDMTSHYPSGALAAMSEKTTLLQAGQRIGFRAIEVDSEHGMKVFLKMLLDSARTLPFAVMSVSPDVDRDTQEEEWAQAARALVGLAFVWVLPASMTYRLSDTVGKDLSVFLGAWRFYRPGFSHNSRKEDHPLILRRHLNVPKIIGRFVRMAADEKIGPVPEDWLTFDDVTGTVGPDRRGWIGKLKDIWGMLTSRGQRGYPAAHSSAGGAKAVSEPSAAQYDGAPGTAPAVPGGPVGDGGQAPVGRDQYEKVRVRLREAEAEREMARERLKEVEAQRDEAVERAKRLEGLVLIGGGDADAPFPTKWDEFAHWCDHELGKGVVLAPSARREMDSAVFADVVLAARCLHWLADKYRRARHVGNNPHLRGPVQGIEGVYNLPCGGDAFDFSLRGRRLTADWHLKNGGNTRDPERCLRVYYAWDDLALRVVVASMPGHRRTAMS